jgi:hypothetical protein
MTILRSDMRRIVLALAIAAGLAIGTALPTSALGLTQVTLDCDDGTSVEMLLDADSLLGLTQAVQAMNDYPAGLTCTIR